MLNAYQVPPLVVLVVEDDGPVRRAIVAFLREEGCIVFEAVTGEQAIDFLDRADAIDVVFTDLRLCGKLNGWDVAEIFHAVRADLPVSYGSGNPIEPSRPVSGSVFFEKPYHLDGILDACVRMCGRGPGRGAATNMGGPA